MLSTAPDHSMTDCIAAVICRELDRRRPQIDGDTGLRRMVIEVNFSERTGRPFEVVMERRSVTLT